MCPGVGEGARRPGEFQSENTAASGFIFIPYLVYYEDN